MEEGNGNEGFMSKVRNQSVAFGASVQEGWEYIKASITGQVKKVQAKNEKEATEADMQTAKAQVEATDAAEAKKEQLNHSMSKRDARHVLIRMASDSKYRQIAAIEELLAPSISFLQGVNCA